MKWKEIVMKLKEYTVKSPTDEEKRMADRRETIEAELRADGYDDPDIIEFEIDMRLGLLSKEPFDSI